MPTAYSKYHEDKLLAEGDEFEYDVWYAKGTKLHYYCVSFASMTQKNTTQVKFVVFGG